MKIELKMNLKLNIWYYIRHEKRIRNKIHFRKMNLVYIGRKNELEMNLEMNI